jgi:Protein of unknown function (DUF2786)
MSSIDQPLLDRVRKLLAKAEKTDNPHEAEAFSAKAAELIALHRIEPAHLAAAADERLELRRIPLGRGAYVRARLALLGRIAEAHDAEVVFQTGPEGLTAILAGFSGDLDVVELLFHSLHTQAASQMAAIRRPTPAATQRWRRAFLFGFATRVGELLTTARHDAAAAAAGTGRPNGDRANLPDVPGRADQVRDFVAGSFDRVVAASKSAPAAAAGWQQGHRAAGQADLGRSRLGSRPAIGRGGPGS